MRSAHSMTLAWTPHAERRRPKMVLERISPSLWSGFWRETNHEDCLSPSTVPLSSPEGAPDPEFNPESPEAHKCPHPPTRSCLLLRCRLSAPLPTINMVRAPRDCHPPTEPVGWSDEVQPEERSPQAMAGQRPTKAEPAGRGSPVELVHRHPSIHQLHRTPFSRQLHLGPQDLRISASVSRALGSTLAPPDPQHPPGSLALRLRLGLLHHLLRHRWSAPWSRRPFLLHGFSLRQLYLGPSSWLWPGSCCAPPAPGPSCLLPGSSFLRRLSCLCPSSSSWASSLIPTCSPLCCSTARGRTFREGGDMSGLWTCFAPVSVQCSIIWSCSSPRLV